MAIEKKREFWSGIDVSASNMRDFLHSLRTQEAPISTILREYLNQDWFATRLLKSSLDVCLAKLVHLYHLLSVHHLPLDDFPIFREKVNDFFQNQVKCSNLMDSILPHSALWKTFLPQEETPPTEQDTLFDIVKYKRCLSYSTKSLHKNWQDTLLFIKRLLQTWNCNDCYFEKLKIINWSLNFTPRSRVGLQHPDIDVEICIWVQFPTPASQVLQLEEQDWPRVRPLLKHLDTYLVYKFDSNPSLLHMSLFLYQNKTYFLIPSQFLELRKRNAILSTQHFRPSHWYNFWLNQEQIGPLSLRFRFNLFQGFSPEDLKAFEQELKFNGYPSPSSLLLSLNNLPGSDTDLIAQISERKKSYLRLPGWRTQFEKYLIKLKASDRPPTAITSFRDAVLIEEEKWGRGMRIDRLRGKLEASFALLPIGHEKYPDTCNCLIGCLKTICPDYHIPVPAIFDEIISDFFQQKPEFRSTVKIYSYIHSFKTPEIQHPTAILVHFDTQHFDLYRVTASVASSSSHSGPTCGSSQGAPIRL